MLIRDCGLRGLVLVAAAASALSGVASGQTSGTLATEAVVSTGLRLPLYVTAPAGDTARLFVVEQRWRTASGQPWFGAVRIVTLSNNGLQTTGSPFLNTPQVAGASEQGLLGLAFHPNYMQSGNGYFWVNYTRASDGATVIARGRAAGGNPAATQAEGMSAGGSPAQATLQTILTITQPANNHNGGWIGFGPDGHLYIATGDGGGGNDNQPPFNGSTGNAQNLGTLLGKILRIDVDGADNIPGNDDDDGILGNGITVGYTVPAGNPYAGAVPGLDEIFAYGVRNPWRMSFDRETGDVWIADVGQEQREEVNFIPAGTLGGRNFGWRCFEGTRVTGLGGCNPLPTGTVVPILEYGHTEVPPGSPVSVLGCSITGGYVYRGSEIPWLRGTYFFSDYCSGDVVTIRYCGGQVVEVVNRTVELDPPGTLAINNVTSFGEDGAGRMYIVDAGGGQVFRVINAANGPDCNGNGLPDSCEIATGTSTDTNGNGIPDDCEGVPCPPCAADFNQDDGVDDLDIAAFFAAFENGDTCADVNGDEGIDDLDIAVFFTTFEAGC